MKTIPEGYCQCGCGQRTEIAKKTARKYGHVKGKPLRFIHGHNSAFRQGAEHPNYKGGITFVRAKNRWMVRCRDGNSVPYAHVVMEDILGRPLKPGEVVHHINKDSTCDEPWNLRVIDHGKHTTHHNLEREVRFRYNRDYLLKRLRDISDSITEPLTATIIARMKDVPTTQTYARHFGSWQNALKEAGLR